MCKKKKKKRKREKEQPCVGVLQGGRETPGARVSVSPGAGERERGGRCGGRVPPVGVLAGRGGRAGTLVPPFRSAGKKARKTKV